MKGGNLLPDFSKQFKVLDEELVYEKVKQISIQVFYSIIVNKDVEEALSNIGDEIKFFDSIVYIAPIQYVKSFMELDNEFETMRIG